MVNCQNQCLLLIRVMTKSEFEIIQRTFSCDVCLLCWETKAAVAQGLQSIVKATETDRKGRLYTVFRDLSPYGMITSVSQRTPLWARGGQGPRQSDKTEQRPPSQHASVH